MITDLYTAKEERLMAQLARLVIVISPAINPLTRLPMATPTKRHVAGYARVSTDSDE